MVLGRRHKKRRAKRYRKARVLNNRQQARKELAISWICGLLLVVAAFPEVAFLGATFRANDITFHLATHIEEDVNVFPANSHRQVWHAQHDLGGAFLQSVPGMEFMRVSLQNGESLYWNPYSACGSLGPETLVDNKFAVVNWIYALFGGGQRVFDLLFLASVWLAVASIHRFLRGVCNLSQIAAWAGAAFFAFNGFSVANLGTNVTWSYYFLPPCLLACSRLLEQANPRRLVAASISVAAVLSFTFIPTTAIGLLTVVAVSICYLLGCSERKEQLLKGLVSLFAAGIIALCLVSAIYLPIVESILFDAADLHLLTQRQTPPPVYWTSLLSLFSSSHYYESYNAFWHSEYAAYHGLHKAYSSFHVGIVAAFFAGFALVAKHQHNSRRFLVWGSLAIMLISFARIFGLPGYSWLVAQIPIFGDWRAASPRPLTATSDGTAFFRCLPGST